MVIYFYSRIIIVSLNGIHCICYRCAIHCSDTSTNWVPILLTAESFKYIGQCQNLQDLRIIYQRLTEHILLPSTCMHVLSPSSSYIVASSTLLANAQFDSFFFHHFISLHFVFMCRMTHRRVYNLWM